MVDERYLTVLTCKPDVDGTPRGSTHSSPSDEESISNVSVYLVDLKKLIKLKTKDGDSDEVDVI